MAPNNGQRQTPEDLFPDANPVFLDAASETAYQKDIYMHFHGYGGSLTLYETSPGSCRFFLVDMVVRGETTSMHAWQVTSENALVRMQLNPAHETPDRVAVGGCPAMGGAAAAPKEAEANVRPPDLDVAVFFLPGTVLPTLSADEMSVVYPSRGIEIRYVPRKDEPCPVC